MNTKGTRCAAISGHSRQERLTRADDTGGRGPRYARLSEARIQKNKHLEVGWCLFFWILASL
jgi:hypothetical protein